MSEIVNGRRAVTAAAALHLARSFGSTPESWLNVESSYDLQRAGQDVAGVIERDVRAATRPEGPAEPRRGQGAARTTRRCDPRAERSRAVRTTR